MIIHFFKFDKRPENTSSNTIQLSFHAFYHFIIESSNHSPIVVQSSAKMMC